MTSIEDCPEIADGEGSVVTARFVTREVHATARVQILGPSGEVETLEGTPVHPIWSVERNDWVPLGELEHGEKLKAADGNAIVLSVTIESCAIPVYNIEVHGEHVYEVGSMRLLVHNNCDVLVSRWGREGLQHGDWVMEGAATWRNYVFSGKWQPGFTNEFASFSSGVQYVVPKSFLVPPPGLLGKLKAFFGQRIYVGPGL